MRLSLLGLFFSLSLGFSSRFSSVLSWDLGEPTGSWFSDDVAMMMPARLAFLGWAPREICKGSRNRNVGKESTPSRARQSE